MNTTALLFMIITEGIITGFMLYFFLKVLFMKPKVGVNEDSYLDNDESETFSK
ncbi:MAG: hypothetical protein PHR81_10800 [Bacteroidales bacterium]|jgi:hypothetical protein|nr:hypothetical protein [Bacteroidales bacterium]MDD4215290.1 hypothetical protein [Bacteroidales bacterium]